MKTLRFLRALPLVSMLLASPGLASQATIVGPVVGPHNMADVMGTINAAFLAIQGCNSGISAPANGPGSAPLAYQMWCDTTTNPVVVKMYNGTSWVVVGKLNTSSNIWTPSYQGTDLGTASIATTGTSGHAVPFLDGNNIVSGIWSFNSGNFQLNGSTSGTGTLNAPAIASSYVWTLPAATDTLAGIAFAQTITNKTFNCASNTCTVRLGSDVTGTLLAANFPTLAGDITTPGASLTTTLANIPNAVPAAGSIIYSNIAAPSSPAAGNVSVYTDSTDLRLHDKNASGVIGTTVVADTGTANNYISAISAAGAITKSRPACATLSDASVFCNNTSAASLTGTLAAGQFPALTGDVTTSSGSLATTIAANAVTNAKMATMTAYTIKANATGGAAGPTDVSIPALTQKASPVSADMVMIVDSAASNALKYALVSSLSSAGAVSSIAGNTGAFTLANGIDNSTNQIQLTAARRTLPTTQVFTSGSGTYTTPSNVLWIEVELVGGGGGGAGSGTSPGAAGDGGATTFSTLTGNGGVKAAASVGGAGGTASGGFVNKVGGVGGNGSGTNTSVGGSGASSFYGGAGMGGAAGAGAGKAAATNSGSGGGGGGVNTTVNGGGGGGAGGFVRAIINSPASTYSYGVGAAGTAGTTGTGGAAGSAGGAGSIQIIEHYGT